MDLSHFSSYRNDTTPWNPTQSICVLVCNHGNSHEILSRKKCTSPNFGFWPERLWYHKWILIFFHMFLPISSSNDSNIFNKMSFIGFRILSTSSFTAFLIYSPPKPPSPLIKDSQIVQRWSDISKTCYKSLLSSCFPLLDSRCTLNAPGYIFISCTSNVLSISSNSELRLSPVYYTLTIYVC